MIANPLGTVGVFEEEEDQTILLNGRETNEAAIMRGRGKKLRDEICLTLSQRGLTRPINPIISRRDRHHRTVIA